MKRLAHPPKLLSELLKPWVSVSVREDCFVHGLALDSREVKPGMIFAALPGHRADGRDYILDAIHLGATVLLYDDSQPLSPVVVDHLHGMDQPVLVFAINDLRQQMATLAARFYDFPARELILAAVTGTNGKTTCSYLLAHALQRLNLTTGLIGTLGQGMVSQALVDTGLTTPDAVTTQYLFRQLRQQGCQYVVCEASSHGLSQNRLGADEVTPIDLAIFTQLSREHEDYHQGCMQQYAAAKAKLFQRQFLRTAVINIDDPVGRQLLESTQAKRIIGYSCQPTTEPVSVPVIRASQCQSSASGIQCWVSSPFGEGQLTSNLLGEFQIANCLAVLGGLIGLGVEFKEALMLVAELPAVPGRMEYFPSVKKKPHVIVDYAHTEDALARVLQSVRPWCSGKLWCVFGCGGGRNHAKRAKMGQVAEQYSDQLLLTNDNPRDEDPGEIIADIQAGLLCPWAVIVERDRGRAITDALTQAGPKDWVVIAGKGHETTVQIGEQVLHHSDQQWVKQVQEGEHVVCP